MNIAFIIHNQANTGPYYKVLELCRALVQLHNKVVLICTSPTNRLRPESWNDAGVEVLAFPDMLWGRLRQGADLWNAYQRRKWLLGQSFDIIHAIDCRPNVILPALAYKQKYKIPLILSWWDLFGEGGLAEERSGKMYARTLGRIEAWFEVAFRTSADGATVISNYLREKLLDLGFPPERILLQYAGVDSNTPVLHKQEARQQLGLPPEGPYFCFVGTMYDTDFAIYRAAMRRVLQEFPSCRTLWVGNYKIAPEDQKELNIIHAGRLPTASAVHMHIAAADICLLPMKVNLANKARWHSKVTDYWNASRPVLTTAVSDFPLLFRSHDMGWISPADDAQSFADTILQALHQPEHIWLEKGNNAKNFVQQHLDVRRLAQELIQFYSLKGVSEVLC